MSIYIPILPQLTLLRVAQGYEVEGGLSEQATPERVAEEAFAYADAAVKRVGFKKAGEK